MFRQIIYKSVLCLIVHINKYYTYHTYYMKVPHFYIYDFFVFILQQPFTSYNTPPPPTPRHNIVATYYVILFVFKY